MRQQASNRLLVKDVPLLMTKLKHIDIPHHRLREDRGYLGFDQSDDRRWPYEGPAASEASDETEV